MYQGYLYKSAFHWSQSNLDSVIASMKNALKFAQKLKDDGKISTCYVRLAMAQSNLGNYDEAKRLTYKALEIAKRSNDWEGLYYSYYRLGNTYYYENDFENALANYLKVDSIFQHHERKEPALAASLANIGQIYMELHNFAKAKDYFLRSKEQYRLMDRAEGVMYIGFNMGKLEFNKGNYQNSIDSLIPVLDYYSNTGNINEVSDISGWIGASYLKLQDYTKAEKYYEQSVNLAEKTNKKLLIANGLVGLAEVEKFKGNPNKSITHLKKALEIYDGMNITYNKSQILKNLATAYSEKKDYKTAIEYLEAFQSLEDSIVKQENSKQVHELEAKYENEKKEQEIALLKSQNELAEQQKRNQRNLLLGGLGITSLAGIFLFLLFQNRQKTNKKLRELDQLKSNFFANISHEFRTPLTLISTPVEQKLASGKLSKTDRQDFEMIQRNSQRLVSLVDQLLDLSKLEAGKYQLRVAKGNLGNLIHALGESFQFTAKQQDIAYKIDVEGLQEAWFDKDVVEKIMANLLSNAMKYTDKGGSVSLKAKRKNDKAVILVENTASALNPENLEKLFDRFYQANANAEGVGIGLSLVKELVGVNHGSIKADQTSEGTLQFEIVLPIAKSAFKKEEFAEQSFNEAYVVPSNPTAFSIPIEASNDINEDDDRDILLLVEDNAEVRQLLRNTFMGAYRILEAADGQEGIEKALEHVPDLIISDIMMPKVNGLRLCETLKTDERTSHIPIILLTAKAGEEDQYKGLSTGADAYITKPFKTRMLETRVKNLITSRKALRNRYSQEVILKPKDIAITNLDERFLERVQKVLHQKLTESTCSIQEFSEAVGMSRMQLHRKLKALTGHSASEFVRSQRLKLAATLLQNSDANVSEIGFQVGFNDPSYFTKCFREAYGVSPTEYSKKNAS